jgi:hypothetical protein
MYKTYLLTLRKKRLSTKMSKPKMSFADWNVLFLILMLLAWGAAFGGCAAGGLYLLL